MNVLAIALSAVKAGGARAFVVWLALCGATVLAFELFSDQPLDASKGALKGMAVVNALVVLLAWQVARMFRRRKATKAGVDDTERSGSNG